MNSATSHCVAGKRGVWTGAGFLCVLLVIGTGAGCTTQQPVGQGPTSPQPAPLPVAGTTNATRRPPAALQDGTHRILQVEDGNTLVLDSGHRIRLLGIDAPEIRHPELPVQRFGREAAEYLKSLAEGRDCTLKYEGAGFYDDRGRVLAYVYVNGKMLNEEVLRNGYALLGLAFPFGKEARFLEIEHDARARQVGIWHLSLSDGRIANLVARYDALSKGGRMKLDSLLEELVAQYPARPVVATDAVARPHDAAKEVVPQEAAPTPVQTAPRTPAPPDGSPVPWPEAARYYGKQAVIEGEVAATFRSEAVCFLNFNPDYNKDFFAVIPASAFQQFPPDPETYYKGRHVRITGVVREYKGRPQILLESPKQIEVME